VLIDSEDEPSEIAVAVTVESMAVPLTFDAMGDQDQLYVQDSSAPNAKTYTITNNYITDNTNTIHFSGLAGSNAGVILYTNDASNAIQIDQPAMFVVINDDGTNSVTLQMPESLSAPNAQFGDPAALYLLGGSSNHDSLTIDDSATNGTRGYVVAGDGNVYVGADGSLPADQSVANYWVYGIVSSLWIKAGAGDDTFDVNTTADNPVTTISGGSGSDTVNVDSTTSGTTTTVNSGSGNDTVNVLATGAGSTTKIDGTTGSGNVTVNLEGATNNSIDAIAGPVTFTGGSGDNQLAIDDEDSETAGIYNLTSNTFQRTTAGGGSPTGLVTYSGLTDLTLDTPDESNTINVAGTGSGTDTALDTGSGSDTVNVTATASGTANTTIIGGTGNDTVNLGTSSSATISSILGPVVFNGGTSSTNHLKIYDESSTGAPYTDGLTSTTFQRTAARNSVAGVITYQHVADVTVNTAGGTNSINVAGTVQGINTTIVTGTGSNTTNITSTAADTTTTITGGSGSDTVNLDGAENHNIDAISGAVDFTGGGGANYLVVHDQDAASAAGPYTYYVTSNTFQRTAGNGSTTGLVTYSGVPLITTYAPAGNNTIDVASTASGGSAEFYTEAGSDTIDILSSATASTTTIHGGSGDDTIDVSAANATMNIYGGSGEMTLNLVDGGDDTVNRLTRSASSLGIHSQHQTPDITEFFT